MKIGAIGPTKSIDRISEVVNESFRYIELLRLDYDIYKEAPYIARRYQKEMDGLIFTGTTPFILANKIVQQEVPWEYIPRHGSSLLTVLLEASVLNGYDISNISFDCYRSDLLYEAYEEIGFSRDEINIYIAEERILKDDYLDYLFEFHKENYRKGNVSCCFTGLVNVNKRLLNEKIPVFRMTHTSNIIRETITKLKLKHLAYINQSNQIIVLSVEIDLPNEQSIINKDEYQMALKNMRVTEQIYLFAKRIQAAVVEVGFGSYLLFSTKSILESETKNLSKIDLLSMINKNTSSTVSIGIGYGRTAREAKYGANLGKERAKKCGGNRVFVVYEGEKILGPINNVESTNNEEKEIDENLLKIAQSSGLGINTIFKLNSIIKQYRLDTVTPKELARLYGVTLRSMNRIILKLEEASYVKVIGKKPASNTGRPSRVIHMRF